MGGVAGGKKGGTTPAPDFSKAAMAGQANPYGSVSWTTGPDGKPTMNTGFSGPMQGVFDNVVGGMTSASQMDPTAARDQAVNQNLGYGMSQLQPMWAQENQNLKSQAANMGLDPGSQGYNAQYDNLSRKQGNQYASMYNTALNAGNETQRTQMAQAMQPFAQAGMMQNWLPQGNPGAPLAGAKMGYEAAKDATSAGQGKKGSTMGGLGSIAGTIFGGPLGGMAIKALGNLFGGSGGGYSASDLGNGYDPNLGGYNF